MNEFDVIISLICDAKKEKEYMGEYLEAEKRAEKSGYPKIWSMRSPSKQRILDDLRVVRRLTLEIERRMRNEQ